MDDDFTLEELDIMLRLVKDEISSCQDNQRRCEMALARYKCREDTMLNRDLVQSYSVQITMSIKHLDILSTLAARIIKNRSGADEANSK